MKKTKKAPRQNIKVLVVDDNLSIINFFTRLLKETTSLSTALSGEDAVILAEKTKYDLAFVDIMLPGIDGGDQIQQAG